MRRHGATRQSVHLLAKRVLVSLGTMLADAQERGLVARMSCAA